MSNNVSQGAYAPLPQSLSDSDSEKEMHPELKCNLSPSNVEDNMLHNGYSLTTHAAIVPEVRKVTPPMSMKRKIAFLFSILLCFFTVIIFLWVLPCSESGTCPVRIANWEMQHEGIELRGKINVVKSAFRNMLNLALLFKRDIRFTNCQSGVISIMGNSGIIAWYMNQSIPPDRLNCYLIDVNNDGINDCLVINVIGLEAVDPISGLTFWYAHNHTQGKPIAGLDLPIILQDLNHDNVREILTTYNLKGECKVLIISGKTGLLMGEIAIKNCDDFHIVESNLTSFIYLRLYKNRTYYHQVTVDDIVAQIFERVEVLDPPLYKSLPVVDLGYALAGHRLYVENLGTCRITNRSGCPVKITLLDAKTHSNLFSWSYQNAFGFYPVLFSFRRTRSNLNSLKGHVNGFIIKLWQWNSNSMIVKRSIPQNNTDTANYTIKVNTIMERILLITFNTTNFHIVNASLTNITQLCMQGHSNDYSNCQPSTENQMNSLLISDLDMDGSQEFISYSNTFVNRNDLKDDWQLVSSMKVIRLENELPKFFEVNNSVT